MLINTKRWKKGNINMFTAFVVFIFLVLTPVAIADSEKIILLDPSGDGGFQSGQTFASNGWIVENGGETNKWELGNIPFSLFGRSAYISTDGGATWGFDPISPSIVHFYRDIFVPDDADEVYLRFAFRGRSNQFFERIQVYNVPPVTQITAGMLIPFEFVYITPPDNYIGYHIPNVKLNVTPGTTFRLVFSWINGTGGEQPPMEVDLIEVSYTRRNPLNDNFSWSNPKPQGNDFNAIVALDENTAVGVGDNGTVGKTTDRGSTWDFIFNVNGIRDPINDIVKAVSMTAQSILQAAAGNNLLTSEDDGDSWMTSPINPSGSTMNSLAAKDSILIAVGENGEIYLSTDGGMTWTQIFSGITQHLNTVEIAPNGQFVIIGGDNNAILKSGNGGMTFSPSTQMGLTPNNNILDIVTDPSDPSGNTFYVGQSGGAFKTTDGGSNFTPVLNANTYTNFITINPGNPMIGFGGGAQGKIFYTTNGWNSATSFSTGQADWHQSGDYFSPTDAIINGYVGNLYQSSNSGETFTRTSTGTTNPLNAISYAPNQFGLDYEIGYAVGGPNTVLKTTNRGEDWDEINIPIIPPPVFLETVAASTDNNVLAFGPGATGIRTTDGFDTFEEIDNPNPLGISKIIAVGDSFFIAVGRGLDIFLTFTNGDDWVTFPTTVPEFLLAIALVSGTFFQGLTKAPEAYNLSGPDSIILVAVGQNGRIIKSTDGGQTWTPKLSPTIEVLLDVHFVDPLVGHAVGLNGTFIRSTDGGETWTQMPVGSSIENPVGSSSDFNAVSFIGPDLGIIASNDGIIFRTLDGGVTWDTLGSPTSNNLQDIVMLDPYSATAVGFGGTIIHAEPDSIIIVGVEDWISEGSLPAQFTLEQNYPNPFNPATSIEYRVVSREYVKLKVFDMLGREVATLVNEELSPGVYTVEWNAENSASGIYFYKLQAGDFVQTRKMVLLK